MNKVRNQSKWVFFQRCALGVATVGLGTMAHAEGTMGLEFTTVQTAVVAAGGIAVTAALVPFGSKMAVAFGKGVFKLLFR